MVFLKNPRDVSRIMALAHQMYPQRTKYFLKPTCEYTVLFFVNTLTRWRVSLSAEKPCYSFYISRKTELILDRLRYITKYRRTLSVSAQERYDFLVSICPVSLVSCRWRSDHCAWPEVTWLVAALTGNDVTERGLTRETYRRAWLWRIKCIPKGRNTFSGHAQWSDLRWILVFKK
jgi:hypothetical protein